MFEWLNTWWAEIPGFERIFWFIALPASVVTLLQLILEFVGFGGNDTDLDMSADADVDVSLDSDTGDSVGHDTTSGLRIFTIKGFIIFFTLFGWTGITVTRSGIPALFTVIAAFAMGFGAMVLVAWIFKTLHGLSESGTLQIDSAIGHRGTVYLTIPAEGKGSGQIQIKLQGATQTLDAISYEKDKLATGTNVKVTEVLEDNTLVVINDLTIE
jgi:hypothetical protein